MKTAIIQNDNHDIIIFIVHHFSFFLSNTLQHNLLMGGDNCKIFRPHTGVMLLLSPRHNVVGLLHSHI